MHPQLNYDYHFQDIRNKFNIFSPYMKYIITFTVLLSLSMTSLIAQSDEYSWENQPEILERKDSIILASNSNDQLYLNYQMKEFQTVYRVSKFFGSNAEAVYSSNQINTQTGVPPNAVLKIPF